MRTTFIPLEANWKEEGGVLSLIRGILMKDVITINVILDATEFDCTVGS